MKLCSDRTSTAKDESCRELLGQVQKRLYYYTITILTNFVCNAKWRLELLFTIVSSPCIVLGTLSLRLTFVKKTSCTEHRKNGSLQIFFRLVAHAYIEHCGSTLPKYISETTSDRKVLVVAFVFSHRFRQRQIYIGAAMLGSRGAYHPLK